MFLTKLDFAKVCSGFSWGARGEGEMGGWNLEPDENRGQPDGAAGSWCAIEMHPYRDQVLWLVEGEVLAEVAEERARMVAGHIVLIPAGVPHRLRNSGSHVARGYRAFIPGA
jgi:hypothetical protein